MLGQAGHRHDAAADNDHKARTGAQTHLDVYKRQVLSILDDSAEVQYTYELDAPLTDKIEAVATKIYRAGRVSYTAAAIAKMDAAIAADAAAL